MGVAVCHAINELVDGGTLIPSGNVVRIKAERHLDSVYRASCQDPPDHQWCLGWPGRNRQSEDPGLPLMT